MTDNKQIIAKLQQLKNIANKLISDIPIKYDYVGTEEKVFYISDLLDKTRAVLRRFKLDVEVKEVNEFFTGGSQEDFLEIVCEPPDRKAEFLVVRRLLNMLDNLIYAYSNNITRRA